MSPGGGGASLPPRSSGESQSSADDFDPAPQLAKLPKRVSGPGQRAKTRGSWIDSNGQEHELVSGQHDREYQEAEAHARRLRLIPEKAKLRAAADVELKFAMRMRRERISRAHIVINNQPCLGDLSCDSLLSKFLPGGAELTVHGPDGFQEDLPREA